MKRSNKYNKVCVFCVCVIYFLFVLFWVGAISAGEEDCFPVLQCVLLLLLFHFYLACEQLLVNRRVCVSVFRSVILYEIVFFCFIKMFHLRWRKYYTHICWFEEICDFVFGSYRVINVHKGVRTMLLIFLSLSFFLYFTLKCGILFWCYFVFFSFSLMYVHNRMCLCVDACSMCELV